MKNQSRGEDCRKRGGALGQFAKLRQGDLGKKEGVVFLRGEGGGGDTPMHTM